VWNSKNVAKTLALALLAITALTGCGTSRLAAVPSSGVADVDQTAAFLAHVIERQREAKRFNDNHELAEWLVSAQGSAEYIPPSPEFEPQAAERYRGPRPADGVAIWEKHHDVGSFGHFIIVSSDGEHIVLDAFRNDGSLTPFFTWRL
jgi:hypothetical protein